MSDCAVDGCDRPVEAAGLCAGHRKRKVRGKTVSGEVKEYAKNVVEGLPKSSLDYANAADNGSNEDFELAKERFRAALRRYLWEYVPRLLARHPFPPEAKPSIESFLKTYRKRR